MPIEPKCERLGRRSIGRLLHPLHHGRQHDAGRVQSRQPVLQTVEVLALFLGQQEALGVPLCDDLSLPKMPSWQACSHS
jgi:hypothetical protein